MPTASYVPQQDHTKKIKDYQQYLLQRHEQSKKVLADTRAEIERRRQELLQRFPQLASKSPESTETSKEEDQPSSSIFEHL
jgi:acetyl-CoA carboxylase carboxyltransferase component